MDKHYPYKPKDKLRASTINNVLRDTQFHTNSGMMGGGMNSVYISPTNTQGLADITNSNIGDVLSHSVIYAVAQDDGSGFRWYRTRQSGSQAYYTLGNSQIECVGTVVGEDENGDPIVSDNENKLMVAVKPMVIGEKYVLRCQGTLESGMAAYWNGYRLYPISGNHRREFITQRTETNIQLPFDASGVTDTGIAYKPEALYSDERPFTNSVVLTAESSVSPSPMPDGWVYTNTLMDLDGTIIPGAIGPRGQFWIESTGLIGRVVPYRVTDDASGREFWRGFIDPLWPEGVDLQVWLDANSQYLRVSMDTYANGLDKPMQYTQATERDYAEAVYNPVADDEGDEYVEGLARIVFPVNYPPVNHYLVPDPRFKDDITARGLTACAMGLAEIVGAELPYQKAYWGRVERIPFEVYVLSATREAPTDPPYGYEGCYGLQYTWTYLHTLRGSDAYLFKCSGSFKSDPLGTAMNITLDPMNDAGVECYQRKFSVKQENSYVYRDTKAWDDIPYEFAYVYDTVENETFILSPPKIAGCVFHHANVTEDSAHIIQSVTFYYKCGDESFSIPAPDYAYYLKEILGKDTCKLKSVDQQTGFLTFEYSDTEEHSYSVKPGSLPFWFGLTGTGVWPTTKKANAQRQYYPVYSPDSDRNEVLVPGELFRFTPVRLSLHSYIDASMIPGSNMSGEIATESVEWTYLSLIPPEKYHTDISCTPYTKVREIKYSKFTSTDDLIVSGKVEQDDLKLESIQDVDTVPETNTPHTIRYCVPRTTNSVVDVYEPFGAFNDCANIESLALFIKTDSDDVKYPCTCRLDYIPYGYAIPTKTPSCFYKATTTDNCAPRLKGVVYDITRVDKQLVVNGGCYVPCSSLAQS